ncbi:cytochrome P450 [Ktedonosporobacter rubrisoli]|uniref:Cytochrome P450 n=1 Tax=Ktedonosporobacter rubrisoli TaxID=2509675 RepID=A0A4P6JTE1_KTERU|nr:cytochrome P450 [Ktedonosporobacter rubrisoli]QBD78585.1 cytochrome P450 [Ktedonosporobacter rubrisoli]
MTASASQSSPSIPSLPVWPLFGNAVALRWQRLELLARISREFGDLGAFHFGPRLVPLLNSPALVHQVLVEQSACFEKTTTVRALAEPLLGNGVFLSEGEEHRRQRRLLAPLFQPRHVLSHAQTVVDCTYRLQETWREGEIINLTDEMQRLTLRIICRILFDADVAGEEDELGEALLLLFRHFSAVVTNPFHLPQSWPTPRNLRMQQALARVDATIYRMIEQRRQSAEERNDYLSLLLRTQLAEGTDSFSDRQIRDQAFSFFVAGHETMTTALTWGWYLLSQHPAVYARLQNEGDRVLAGRFPTAADLPNLPYTLQIFKETLRLTPPVYAFTRRAKQPVQLAGSRIPRGTSVVVSPYTLQRRASFFADPERFDPERFAPANEQALPRYAFIPFGAGPHICLGMPLAQLEAQLILATLAQSLTFEFAGSQPLGLEPLLTLRPKGNVYMKIRRAGRPGAG